MRGVRRRGLPVLGVVVSLLLGACAAAPQGGTPTAPAGLSIRSFSPLSTSVSAPALVPLRWQVVAPTGVIPSCTIDRGSDGTIDLRIDPCPQFGSRNMALEAAGTESFTLEVSAPGLPPVSAVVAVVVLHGPTEPFNIVLRVEGDVDPAVVAVVESAARRWEEVIVRGVPDVDLTGTVGCTDNVAAPGYVDDLVIDLRVAPDDGVGGTLGSAGPCVFSPTDLLPRWGRIELDEEDVEEFLVAGRLEDLVRHEMGHVLGFGVMWGVGRQLLHNPLTADPRFVGQRAVAEWSALGGSGGVPVENWGPIGVRDAHWRDSVFGDELMTSWFDPGPNPVSRLTIASMADLGYHVDIDAADPYGLPGAAMAAEPAGDPAPHTRLIRPDGI